MGTPYKGTTINSAIGEIISGMSALNMEPRPKYTEEEKKYLVNKGEIAGYLSEMDTWAEHSIEHFRAAIEVLKNVESELRKIYYAEWKENGYSSKLLKLSKIVGA
jgi:hypothetical protein